MDTFLKYLPILPAMVAAYMGGRAAISDIGAIRSATKDAGTIPFWRRQIVVMAILFALAWVPFFISLFVPSTAEDIAKATAPLIAERDADRQELNAARHSVIPPPVVLSPTPQPELSASEIAARTELWHSIQNAMNAKNGSVEAYTYGDRALDLWETYIPQNRSDISDAANDIQKLRTDYPNFKDVSETIDQPYLGPLLDSIDDFSGAISTLPEPLPPNYQKYQRKSWRRLCTDEQFQ